MGFGVKRTAALCDGCGNVMTAVFVDGDLKPFGQPACPECGSTEFTEYDPTRPEGAGRTG